MPPLVHRPARPPDLPTLKRLIAGGTPGPLDPARIRASFVSSGHQRPGVATALLRACEAKPAAAGFTRVTPKATRRGVPFYAAHDYRAGPMVTVDAGGMNVAFVPLSKSVLLQCNTFIGMQYSSQPCDFDACDSS